MDFQVLLKGFDIKTLFEYVLKINYYPLNTYIYSFVISYYSFIYFETLSKSEVNMGQKCENGMLRF